MPVEPIDPALELVNGEWLLRPWRLSDAAALLEAVQASLPSLGRWLDWCHAGYGEKEAQAWVRECRQGWLEQRHFAFAICDRDSGELRGSAGLNQFNPQHRIASLGYWVRQSHQGQGIASRAAATVARFGFEQLALARIEIVVLPDNHASRSTAEKAGAKLEGLARHRLWTRNRATDALVYSLIPEDLVQPPLAQSRATSS